MNKNLLIISALIVLLLLETSYILYLHQSINISHAVYWNLLAPIIQNILSSVLIFLLLGILSYFGLGFLNENQMTNIESSLKNFENMILNVKNNTEENISISTDILKGKNKFSLNYIEDIKFSELFEASEEIYILTNYFKNQISSIKPSIEKCALNKTKITLLMPDEGNQTFVKNLTRVYEKTESEITLRIRETEKAIREIYDANQISSNFRRIYTEDLGVFFCIFLSGDDATILLSPIDFKRSASGIKAPFFILKTKTSDKLFNYFKNQIDFLVQSQEKVKSLKNQIEPRKRTSNKGSKLNPDGSNA